MALQQQLLALRLQQAANSADTSPARYDEQLRTPELAYSPTHSLHASLNGSPARGGAYYAPQPQLYPAGVRD